MITFLFDEGGDWEALYVDGRKIIENHSLSSTQVLDALGIEYERREVPEDPYGDGFPETL